MRGMWSALALMAMTAGGGSGGGLVVHEAAPAPARMDLPLGRSTRSGSNGPRRHSPGTSRKRKWKAWKRGGRKGAL